MRPWFACALALVACGASSDQNTPASVGDPPAGGDETLGEISAGLQYGGSVATELTSNGSRFELSAPLFPDMTVFQRFQAVGEYERTSATERLSLIDANVKTFGELLRACSPTHSKITLRSVDGSPLTTAQLRTNYDEVARCAYDQFGAKPYWVPQQVIDDDICARKLGATWHLPSETEIANLTDSDFQMFSDTMTALPGKDWFPVEWYYRLEIYVRPTDGELGLGNLAPGSTHVSPLPVPAEEMSVLYLGNGSPIGLRCLRAAPGP